MKSVIDIFDLSTKEVDDLLELAGDIIENPAKYAEACHGKKLATLFLSRLPVHVCPLRRQCTSLAAT